MARSSRKLRSSPFLLLRRQRPSRPSHPLGEDIYFFSRGHPMGDGVVSRYLGNASVLAIRLPQHVVVARFDDHLAPCAPSPG